MITNTSGLREFVWKTFENTGSIDAYSFYREIEEKRKVLDERQTAEEEVAISS